MKWIFIFVSRRWKFPLEIILMCIVFVSVFSTVSWNFLKVVQWRPVHSPLQYRYLKRSAQYFYPISFTISRLSPFNFFLFFKSIFVQIFISPSSYFPIICSAMSTHRRPFPSILTYLLWQWAVQWKEISGQGQYKQPASQKSFELCLWNEIWHSGEVSRNGKREDDVTWILCDACA